MLNVNQLNNCLVKRNSFTVNIITNYVLKGVKNKILDKTKVCTH